MKVGDAIERSWTVEPAHLATAYGSGTVDVLATPALIAFCEETSRAIVDPELPAGQGTVGTAIDFRHLAPTPPGVRVTVVARLIEIDERRLCFEVIARDPIEEVGRGTHERFIIDRRRFRDRVLDKGRSAAA
jgi:fluoroacetyl-CoA thioesterase